MYNPHTEDIFLLKIQLFGCLGYCSYLVYQSTAVYALWSSKTLFMPLMFGTTVTDVTSTAPFHSEMTSHSLPTVITTEH